MPRLFDGDPGLYQGATMQLAVNEPAAAQPLGQSGGLADLRTPVIDMTHQPGFPQEVGQGENQVFGVHNPRACTIELVGLLESE